MTPKDLYSLDRDPTFDQLKNAITGHIRQQNNRMEHMRNVVYGAARYNAANTAMSKDASRAISRQKFPWEKTRKRGQPEFINYDKIKGIFEGLSKN